MLRRILTGMGLPSLLLGAACSSDVVILPPLSPCTVSRGQAINLAVGEYASVDPIPDSGCVVFSGNSSGTNSVEFLLVAQSVSGTPGVKANFLLRGDTIVVGAVAAASVLPPPPPPPRLRVGPRSPAVLPGLGARGCRVGSPPRGPARPAPRSPHPPP